MDLKREVTLQWLVLGGLLTRIFIICLSAVAGLSLWEPKISIFKFRWKRVFSLFLIFFSVYQIVSLFFDLGHVIR